MEHSQWPLAVGLTLVLLLAGCLSGTGIGQSPSSPTDGLSTPMTDDPPPTPSSTSTANDNSSSAACVNSVAFYGLDTPGETAWAPNRIAIGYTVPANASIFFVAFEEGTVIGTTHVTTRDLEHGVTADGDGIPLDRRLTGSHMIRVGAYTDTNDNGQFDFGDDMPCKSEGHPVEAGPRRVNFSSFTEPTRTPTTTLAPVPLIPSPSDCLTDAVPRPDTVDGVNPSDYPEPPAHVTRESLVNWTQTFETAYFRNVLLADEAGDGDGDDEDNLTEASAYAEVRGVNQTANGYVIRLSDSGARTYASGILSERWMDVGYLINETHVVRVPLTDREDPVQASDGTAVINC